MEVKLPQSVLSMADMEGMRAEQIGSIMLLDVNIYTKAVEVMAEYMELFVYRYDCKEKWTMSGDTVITSFIVFGTGKQGKYQPNTVAEEVYEFCVRRRRSNDQYLAVYYCSDGGDERRIIIAGVR